MAATAGVGVRPAGPSAAPSFPGAWSPAWALVRASSVRPTSAAPVRAVVALQRLLRSLVACRVLAQRALATGRLSVAAPPGLAVTLGRVLPIPAKGEGAPPAGLNGPQVAVPLAALGRLQGLEVA